MKVMSMAIWMNALVVAALVVTAHCGENEKFSPTEIMEREKEGFVSLFNGKDLTGWIPFMGDPKSDPKETWSVKDGVLTCTGQPAGYIRTIRQYENFIFSFEYRMLRPGNSGALVHMVLPDVVWPKMVECQLYYEQVGSIFGAGGGKFKGGQVLKRPAKPIGEWNSFSIVGKEGNLATIVNGELVATGSDALPSRGYICLQSEGVPIHFRNIRMKDLDEQPLVSLFDGGDLTNWKLDQEAANHWTVRDGVIDYDGKNHDLWTKAEFADFVLWADWRLPDPGDSGIYLRGSSKSQVNIWCDPMGSGEIWGYRTDNSLPESTRGSVTPLFRADKPVGKWNTFEITMKGDRLTVLLNGLNVIDNAELPGVKTKGPIGLQHHGDRVQFRNIYIKELERTTP
jgi:hypothetical protein